MSGNMVILRDEVLERKEFPCTFLCKFCGESFHSENTLYFDEYGEEEIWRHLQNVHEEVFEEYVDFETPDMIDECYLIFRTEK